MKKHGYDLSVSEQIDRSTHVIRVTCTDNAMDIPDGFIAEAFKDDDEDWRFRDDAGDLNHSDHEGVIIEVLCEIDAPIKVSKLPIFKAGDKVRCKPGFKNDDNDTNGGGGGYKEGRIVTIESLRGCAYKKGVIADLETGSGIWTWALELVTEQKLNNKEKEDEVYRQNQQQRGSGPKGNRAIREKIKVTSGCRPTGSRVSNRRRREQPRQTPISGKQLQFN